MSRDNQKDLNSMQTMIAIWYRGKKYPFCVLGFKDRMGKIRPTQDALEDCLNSIGVQDHETYEVL